MTSRSDRNEDVVLVYDDTPAAAEPPAHRFFIDGEEVLRAFEGSGDLVVRAPDEARLREIVTAFQFLDQAEFGGEH